MAAAGTIASGRITPGSITRPRKLRRAAVLLALLSALPLSARTHHSESWARDHFASAERMREALNGRPVPDRTRHDYQRVLNAYRSVYLGAPASAKADPSVVAVAETLVEMGRRFEDDKILKEAISQYRFLRREYPGSRYRFDALFTIGEIYKDDLNNAEQARATFQDFLRCYPHNRLSADAEQAIADLKHPESAARGAEAKAGKNKSGQQKTGRSKTESEQAADRSSGEKAGSGKNESAVDQKAAKESFAAEVASGATQSQEAAVDATPAKLPRVTRIRHWSTPDYTRVAIDLEGEIKFGSQRIAHPDRIVFDLRDTKLASTLVGKSFDVDDGFLKKIRVAQFQPGRTRVVLEIADLSEYDAFLIPNPYRLIIDIHGKDGHGLQAREKQSRDLTAAEDVEAEPKSDSRRSASGGSEGSLINEDSAAPAETGKAPVTSMDVGDGAAIVKKDRPGTKSSSSVASKNNASPVVKKIVEPDDDDDEASANADVKHKSTESPSDDLTAPDVKISANAHTVVSHSRRKSNSKTSTHQPEAELDTREARPTASGDRSLIRALGLKIGKIVIDPGHGGHDTGTIGPNGLEEKDLVLEVGRRLGKLLETRLGAEVVYTRKTDTFIPLETRTAIANQDRADLFISIHANSSHDESARGVETYYLNFTSSPEALEVAARENAVSEKSIYELQDLVKKIALKDKIEESREFAGDVQESLHSGLAVKSSAIRDRGVKKAPFIVLIGANMPSILAEISFVSNPSDERRLETSEYRQRIAESLYRGVARYANGLSGVKVASKLDKATGQ
ncbi:MAG TPA: N-acetylmuramoyl-L-alanine amidase [Candidatus Sulfotelmatobacter sp.]|jgi:N-acetylmuramoyl-L-alanine amidase